MAKLVAGRRAPIDGDRGFDNFFYFLGDVFTYPSSSRTAAQVKFFSNSANQIVFTGTGFTGNATQIVSGGTITGISQVKDGIVQYTITGLTIPAKEYFEYSFFNQSDRLTEKVLSGNDVLIGTKYNDDFWGEDGNDTISGGVGEDLISGNDGNDRLVGGVGGDYLRGDNGNDILIGGAPGQLFSDDLGGGPGFDTADYSASTKGVQVDLAITHPQASTGDAAGDTLKDIEALIGSSKAADSLWGDGLANTLKGLGGSDKLDGRAGNDTLDGGAAADRLRGGAGSDTATYAGSSAKVTIDLRKTTAQLGGDAKGDTLFSIENLIGSRFADFLTGTSGNNTITGGRGADRLQGLGGTDTLRYASSTQAVQVDLSKTTAQAGGDATGDVVSGFENLVGTKFGDTLAGNVGNNRLSGGKGNDTFVFKAGFGKDVITDFTAGGSEDVIQMHLAARLTFDQWLGKATQVGNDTVFTFDTQTTLTLLNVQKTTLTAADFEIA